MASNTQPPAVPDASKDPGPWPIKPNNLTIIWSEEKSYWRIDEREAELLQVCWLEVRGSVKKVSRGKTYEIRFKLSKKADAFGWDDTPVFIMAKIGKESEDQLSKEIYLSGLGEEPNKETAKFQIQFDTDKKTEDPKSDKKREDPKGDKKTEDTKRDKKREDPKSDKKTEDPKNDKKTEDPNSDEDTLYFGLYEVWAGNWKGGLIIHEAIVEEVKPDHASASSSAQ